MKPRFFLFLCAIILGLENLNLYSAETNKTSIATNLFDGKTLTGWRVSNFTAHGDAHVEAGQIIVEPGDTLSGVNWTNQITGSNYVLSLEAMRVDGGDFFCGLTFPVEGTNCTLILGGWGGDLVGLSSIDELDASENETSQTEKFTNGRWYKIRLQVSEGKILAWLDDKQLIKLVTKDHKLGLRRGEINQSLPLGLATYQTKAAFRNITFQQLPPK